MKYLLDTCVVSDFVKGDENTFQRILTVSPSDIAISTITVMEIYYGLLLNTMCSRSLKSMIDDFLKLVSILPFTSDDAAQAAKIRSTLKQQGALIGSYDILLAGKALNHQLIFVSSNTKEFERIKNLKLENWR